MKKMSLLALMIVSTLAIYSQAQTSAVKPPASAHDTIVYYLIDSESMSLKGNQAVYKVNNQIVSQQQWRRMTIGNGQMKTCTPCMVKTYDAKDNLISIGMQYKWCQSGVYTGYYPNGKIKMTGQYKTNSTGRSDKPSSSSAHCGIKEGTWTYYNETGEITKTELYKNGVAVK